MILFAVLAAGCAGPSSEMRQSVNGMIASGNWTGAKARLAIERFTSYGETNAVLYSMDLGVIQHDAGQYKDSNQSLEAAEQRMEELYTRSLSKEGGRFLLNDNTVDYAGERFERVLVNVYRALNYLFLGDRESALVEVRKLSRLLQEYADVYGAAKTVYKTDAFAQYVSALLYADGGQADDARIAFQNATSAYAGYTSAYGMRAPVLQAPTSDGAAGELVFFHANGVAPRKVSQSVSVAWNQAVVAVNLSKNDEAQAAQALNAVRAGLIGQAITVAFPAYVQDPFQIVASEVEAGGRRAATQLVQDVSAIARKDLAERQAAIRARAIARAAIKYILGKAVTDQCVKKYGKDSLTCQFMNLGRTVVATATEVADTRAWGTLPAQFRLARLPLPPGTHDVTVRYMHAGGAVVVTRTFKVTVRTGARAYLHDRTAL